MEIKDKKISVIGAVKSGVGAAKMIKRLGGIPFVSDSASAEKLAGSIEELKKNEINFEVGSHSEKVFDCDFIIISPGVPTNAAIIQEATERKIKIISEIELAFNFCKGKIIAITGTNGKTTTTSLTGHIMRECGFKTYVAGNIGDAFTEIALDVKTGEVVVLEVSSFQLDFIDRFKPKVAMILNITPDHLNRYNYKFQNYIDAKLRIYMNQDESDYVILNKDSESLVKSLTKHKSHDFYFSLLEEQINGCLLKDDQIFYNENKNLMFTCATSEINLKGEHNYANAMAAIIAAKILGANDQKIKTSLGTFPGVEHRLELVRELEGVKYINDSKATNIDAVWYALRSYDEPVFLILGGLDKGNDYNQIKDLILKKVKKIYAIGSSAEKIFNFFHSVVKVEIMKSLEDAILEASREARANEIVLLSPACASFDMFQGFEHRGKVFKEVVNKL
ncbi:MAG: UDP-N-acetylmuramoyl-L-alanine--D-glutamate ligase [Ignavibacteriaceae bacterium]